MGQTIIAIYDNGVLRPLTSLDLEDQTPVELEVRVAKRVKISPDDDRRQIIEAMTNAGLLANTPLLSLASADIAPEEEEELAQLFAGEKSLSEIIIDERREGW